MFLKFFNGFKKLFESNKYEEKIQYKYFEPGTNIKITWTYDQYLVEENHDPCKYCTNIQKNNNACSCTLKKTS